MSPESSGPERPVKLHWTQEPKNKARLRRMRKATMAKRKGKRAKRRAITERKSLISRKVPFYMYTLAKQVRNRAVAYLHTGEGSEELAVNALLLAHKVMEGEKG